MRCDACLGNAFELCSLCAEANQKQEVCRVCLGPCDGCDACNSLHMDPPSHPDRKESYFDRKFDQGKPRYTLLPWDALAQVVQVLEYGAKKYAADSWRDVPNSTDRYLNALIRHVVAYFDGERTDAESKLPTLAHVAVNALFLLGRRSKP